MSSMTVCTSGGGGPGAVVADRRARRRPVRASSRSGSCTPLIPPGLQEIPHRPMAVSNKAKPSAGGRSRRDWPSRSSSACPILAGGRRGPGRSASTAGVDDRQRPADGGRSA